MVCFCKNTMGELAKVLQALNAAEPTGEQPLLASGRRKLIAPNTNGSDVLALAGDRAVDNIDTATSDIPAQLQQIAQWLSQSGLPASPWQPNSAWLELELPTVRISASAMATLQAFAQLRVLTAAQGLDLMVPAQANAFARQVATANARLAALAGQGQAINAAEWAQAAATSHATAQAQAALAQGLLPTPQPMGPPLSVWRGFLSQLRSLLPVISVAKQLDLDLTAELPAQLAPMLRTMLAIPMPRMAVSSMLIASATGGLSAVTQLQKMLGIDPLTAGLAEVKRMVAEQATEVASQIEQQTGQTLSSVVQGLKRVEYCATLMATPATVAAAQTLNTSPLTWQIPPASSLPILSVGLPVAVLSAQLQAAANIHVARSPCQGCDAQALLAAVSP